MNASPFRPAQAVQHSWREIVRGYMVLPHAVPIVVVMTATAAFAIIAAGSWPGMESMFRLLGAMFCGQLAIGAVNELVDAELDAVAKPEKPIPAGLVSLRGAWLVTLGGLSVMTALSLTLGVASFALCALGTGTGIAYSLWFKRTIWSWVPYLIALPLLPIWVWASLESVDPGLFAMYPIGAAAIVAVQIAQSLPDVDADRQSNVRTLAAVLGTKVSRRICWLALLLAAGFACSLAPLLTDRPQFVWIAAVVTLGFVGINAAIWRQNARSGAMSCFPCVAAGAVVLGVGWAAALVA